MKAKGEAKIKTVTLTKEQLRDPAFVNKALMGAMKVEGTAVVRRPDGSISYSDPSKAGQFHEENME